MDEGARENGWQLAKAAGLATPCRFQRLLGRAVWEADVVCGEHLQEVLPSWRLPHADRGALPEQLAT